MKREFILKERKAFEKRATLLEVKFDHRNFYNKMLKLGILSEAEPRSANASRRILSKYCFNAEKYAEEQKK